MTGYNDARPRIATRDEWLAERAALLDQEKALTRQMDAVNAQRRRLPMVRIDKDYVFQGVEGERRLPELFDGCRQLIVCHFMFDPDWDAVCEGLTDAYRLLDRTPYGRQEDFEDSPRGWPQKPTYG